METIGRYVQQLILLAAACAIGVTVGGQRAEGQALEGRSLTLTDSKGVPRINLSVDANGQPRVLMSNSAGYSVELAMTKTGAGVRVENGGGAAASLNVFPDMGQITAKSRSHESDLWADEISSAFLLQGKQEYRIDRK